MVYVTRVHAWCRDVRARGRVWPGGSLEGGDLLHLHRRAWLVACTGYEVQTFGRLFVYMYKVLCVMQQFYVVCYCTVSRPVERSIALATGIAQG